MREKYILVFIVLSILLIISPAVSAVHGQSLVAVEIGAYPKNLPIVVDGVVYTPPPSGSRITLYWKPGSQHSLSVLEPSHYTGPGARLQFTGWSTGESSETITIEVSKNTTILALYTQEYYVQVYSPYGTAEGSGWYKEGERANISVPQHVSIDNGTRATFSGWSTGNIPWSSNDNYLYVMEPTLVKASWTIEYKLTITKDIESAHTEGDGWYPKGATVRVEAEEQLYSMNNSVMYRFSRWNVTAGSLVLDNPSDSVQLIAMNSPVTLQAVYDTYYRVHVSSAYGQVTSDTYARSGDIVQIGIKNPVVTQGDTRFVFQRWSNGQKGPTLVLNVEGPTNITAIWETEYRISVYSTGGGPEPSGAGWYKEGETAVLSVPREASGRLGVKYHFQGWLGDTSGSMATLEMKVTGPAKIGAAWEKSYARLYLDVFGASLLGGGIVAGYLYILKPGSKSAREDPQEEPRDE